MTKHVKNPLQRLIAMLLCVVMVVGFMPLTALAVPNGIDPENVPGPSDSNEGIEAVYLPLTFRDAHVDGIFFEHDCGTYSKDTDGNANTENAEYDVQGIGTAKGRLSDAGVPEYTEASVKKLANRIKAIIDERINIDAIVSTAHGHTDTAEDSNIIVALREKFKKGSTASTEAKSDGYDGTFASITSYYDAALWYLNNLWADGKINDTTPHMMKVSEFESLKLVHKTNADPKASQYHYGYSEYYYYEGQDANQIVEGAEAHYTVFDTEQKMIYNTIADKCPANATDTFVTSNGGEWWPVAAAAESGNNKYYSACDGGKLYFSTVGNGKFVYHKPQEGEKGLFFSFCGDDDVYLFINGKLVIDAGRRQNGVIAFVNLESHVTEEAESTTAPNGINNFTYKGTGVTDTTTTWAEYLGLEDGGIYDFKFFHMERQNSLSKFAIYTNIKVVNPSAVTEKFAYDKNGKLPYGADVPNNVDVIYGLKLTNKSNSDVYYLSYSDPMLGVELDYNTCNLGSNNPEDLELVRTAKDGTVTTTKVATGQELMNTLKEGLKEGESLEIKGFTYNVGAPSEGETKKVIKNTLSTSVIGVSTNSTSWVRISGTADMVLTTTAVPPKVFVIDYAKDLTLNKTDVFGTELEELMKPDEIYSDIEINGISLVGATDNKMVGTYGTLTMVGEDPTNDNWKLQYHLDKFLSGEDKFSLNLNLTRTLKADENQKMAATVNKNVSFIPANNIYYEDDFVASDEDKTGTCGIYYSGDWTEVKSSGNTESAEDQEKDTYGGVHGWEDSLADDKGYSDGSVHGATASDTNSATATFTFTGEGVDIYSRTNGNTGTIVATLDSADESIKVSKTLVVDTVSESGDYYQIPTLSFMTYNDAPIPYGTYKVTIYVTTAAEGRFEYYLDGIRVYNPMQDQNGYDPEERNAIFKEVRDLLAQTEGAGQSGVFIDKLGESGDGNTETIGVAKVYDQTEYGLYGPKNEVYLAKGQSITFKVNPEGKYYYIGLKAPNIILEKDENSKNVGYAQAEVSYGATAQGHKIDHSTDLYYEVVPDADGYIVITNTGDGLLSVTKLRITGETTEGAQVLSITDAEALEAVTAFSARPVVNPEFPDVEIDNPTEPEQPSTVSPAAALMRKMLKRLFTSLSDWFN